MADPKLKIKIDGDSSGYQRALKRSTQETDTFAGRVKGKLSGIKGGLSNLGGGALAAGAAIAGAAAVAWDLAKAAAEDADQANVLAAALKRVAGATDEQVAGVEAFILKVSLATGVADSELRPAMQRLATATGSVEESTRLLGLAMDIAAQTGKPLATVAVALGKAAQGNAKPLEKMTGTILDGGKNAGAWARNQQILNEKFGGAAADKANTYGGKAQRIANAFGEAQEALGEQLLPYLDDFSTWIASPEGGQALADFTKDAGDLARRIGDVASFLKDANTQLEKMLRFIDGPGSIVRDLIRGDLKFPEVPEWFPGDQGRAGGSVAAGALTVNINGAVDPSSTARQVRAILGNDSIRGGYVRQRQL